MFGYLKKRAMEYVISQNIVKILLDSVRWKSKLINSIISFRLVKRYRRHVSLPRVVHVSLSTQYSVGN